MPIEVGLWRLGTTVEKIACTAMPLESRLEDVIAADISILDPQWLLIGRQVPTAYGTFIDLLAMDVDGDLIVIELKRNKTPREVVAQVLDYGSWVRQLKTEDIAGIFDNYLRKYVPAHAGTSLDQAFCAKFSVKAIPEELNEKRELVVVASELDDSTERIIGFLADEYGAAINAVFFRFFRDGANEYLSRVWLRDPMSVESNVIEKQSDEPWNGEYYCSFGHRDDHRNWDDARAYGYIAAGGGLWYTRTLGILEPGARIWVNVPGNGYVGVGIVDESAKPISEFMVADAAGKQAPIAHIVKRLPRVDAPPDELEYFVRVRWLKAVPLAEAVHETGFFGNQNSAAQPKARKWVHTVERLKQRFGIIDPISQQGKP